MARTSIACPLLPSGEKVPEGRMSYTARPHLPLASAQRTRRYRSSPPHRLALLALLPDGDCCKMLRI
ncbi:hypothetical protein Kim5_PB00021 (plasmid) [Rhizobium sp. Kim5]|nr:hypothetical protein Kim5_PB00021 [Rhizobium sp. Kim5]